MKRFPWEAYPTVVRAICIGGDLDTIANAEPMGEIGSSFRSAELCGGTHLQTTEDIVDVLITACRARNQFVKEVGVFLINLHFVTL